MQNLVIDATQYTPKIILDTKGKISIVGKSYPENTFEFYSPIIEWIEQYFATNPANRTVFNIEIIYFNSSSSKLFFELFDLLEENIANHIIEINWIYDEENDTALEAGEDFIEDFENLQINLVVKGE
jgi:hypothetical protein